MPKEKKEDVVVQPTLAAEPEGDENEGDELEDEDDLDDDGEALDVPASAAGKASAKRLLDLLVEKQALQLRKKEVGPKLVEAVATGIDASSGRMTITAR